MLLNNNTYNYLFGVGMSVYLVKKNEIVRVWNDKRCKFENRLCNDLDTKKSKQDNLIAVR